MVSVRGAYGVDWVEDFRRHALDLSGDLQAKDLGLLVVGSEKLAGVDGVDDLPGVRKPDPLAHAVPDKRPSTTNVWLVYMTNEHELCNCRPEANHDVVRTCHQTSRC